LAANRIEESLALRAAFPEIILWSKSALNQPANDVTAEIAERQMRCRGRIMADEL
jgi:hypothetical protein